MSLRTKIGMFALTRAEQRTVAFIVLAVTLGLITQHYRQRASEPVKPPNEQRETEPASPSPTPTSR